MDKKVKEALIDFSKKLHEIEAEGIELPFWLDALWVRITAKLTDEVDPRR